MTQEGADPDSALEPRIHVRNPRLADGSAIYRLVAGGCGLDVNSAYAYLLCADHFASTSCIAVNQQDGELAGFVFGYAKPSAPETLFVWQVGVAPAYRGRQLAGNMIAFLAESPSGEPFSHLEATVAVGNTASEALFESLARRFGAGRTWSDYYGAELFHNAGLNHEPERLVRIGPLNPAEKPDQTPIETS